MALVRYDQANFSAGEIDPKVYARIDYAGYVKGAKKLQNFIVTPQGGFQRRFGTVYVDTATETNPNYCDLYVLEYNDNTTYLILNQAQAFSIYLENVAIATVATPYQKEDIINIRVTQVQNDLVVVHPNYKPKRLVRSNNAADVITAVDSVNNYITLTTALTVGQILPVQFTTSGTLPTTSPQIYTGRTYFALVKTANNVRIYANSNDAALDINYFTITNVGTPTSNLIVQNTWTFSDINFSYYPAYDFNFNYNSLTFTPSAVTGNINLTASGAVFTTEMVGGVFSGNNGVMRITGFSSSTVVSGFTVEDFSSTSAIKGSLSFLGAPAWSDSRGWPRTVGFYQQRLVFAGTDSIPNGVWLSVTNDAVNFDDSEGLSDNAISYYTSSGVGNYVKSITSTESILIHSNTGTYSTPLGASIPVTPSNFYLIEQNKDGVSDIPPVHIDNQIIYVDRSNNNAKNLIYDIIQSRYILKNISVASAHLIDLVVDMASYANPEFTDCSYVFIVNDTGTLGIYQTLMEQDISAWTQASTKNSMSDDSFCHVASGINRSWFLVQRTINNSMSLYIEELSFPVYNDCAKIYRNLSSATLTGLSFLEGDSTVQITGDGFYLGEFTVTGGQVTLPQVYNNVTVGLPIYCSFSPLPVAVQLSNGTSLYKPKHIRAFYINYYQMYGAFMNGTLIPTVDMRHWVLGQPPVPANGVYLGAPMGEWDPFDPYAQILEITQSQPFPTTIIGISYILEM